MLSTPDEHAGPRRQSVRKAGTAGLLGTAIEGYDFAVYAYLVVFIAPLFFPAENRTVGILAGLLALGAGYLARPLGGLFFGRLGDRRGRRFALVVTITMMGSATFLMGALPTYESIGVWAPVLLVLLRIVQGFSVGGELMGAATYVTEHGTGRNHGVLSAIVPFGNSLGGALAPGVVGVVTLLIADQAMGEWGWRVPLLLSLPLTVLVLVLRTRLSDSPEFEKLAERQDVTTGSPVREVLAHHRAALLQVVVLSASVMFVGLFAVSYLTLDMQSTAGRSPGEAARIAAVASFCLMPCQLVTGRLVDRFGRFRLQVVLFAASACVVVPTMYTISDPGLPVAASVLVYVVFYCVAGCTFIPAFGAFTALFPTRVRYTGSALGFGIGSSIGAGFGPFLSSYSADLAGNRYAAAVLFVAVVVLGLVASWTMRPVAGPVAAMTPRR
ncbi:MFS transporter [Pseudonocardia nematodicida]|uniref:MFS transporter n=1 Tax=Pseudonocardia nematodicida TaxID=1206997 RepID=A0ABV1K8N5_9PSEU